MYFKNLDKRTGFFLLLQAAFMEVNLWFSDSVGLGWGSKFAWLKVPKGWQCCWSRDHTLRMTGSYWVDQKVHLDPGQIFWPTNVIYLIGRRR